MISASRNFAALGTAQDDERVVYEVSQQVAAEAEKEDDTVVLPKKKCRG